MPIVIVPNSLRDQINARIDAALNGRPCDEETRDCLYHQLLSYFDQHGTIPDFSLEPVQPPTPTVATSGD